MSELDSYIQVPQPTTLINDLLTRVPHGKERIVDLAKELLPEGQSKISLSLSERTLQDEEKPAPRRRESPRRSHVLHDPTGFADYVETYGSKTMAIYVDVPNEQIIAVLNELAPQGLETVTLCPQPHPSLKPWLAYFGRRVLLREMLDFLRQNYRIIAQPAGRELLLALSQIRASTETTVYEGKGKTSLNGLLIKTQIQGAKDEVLVELPDLLTLSTPLYVSTQSQTFEVDLILESVDGKISALLTCADYHAARQHAFAMMVDQLKEREIEATMAYGCPRWTPWDYLA